MKTFASPVGHHVLVVAGNRVFDPPDGRLEARTPAMVGPMPRAAPLDLGTGQ